MRLLEKHFLQLCSASPNEATTESLAQLLSSEDDSQKLAALRCAQAVLLFAPAKLGAFRLGLLTELQSSDNAATLAAALDLLSVLPDHALLQFVGAKDSMSAIKGCCAHPDAALRAVAIRRLGKLCLRVWNQIERYGETALVEPFESTVELKRFEQDLKDFVCDLLKSFAEEFTGKGELPTDIACLAAYADVFADAIAGYFDFVDPVRRWQRQMRGDVPTQQQADDEEAKSVAFSALVSKLLPFLVEDMYLILNRWKLLPSAASRGFTKMITTTLAVLLNESYEAIVPAIQANAVSAFAPFGAQDEKGSVKASRSEPLPQNAQQLAEEWMLRYLNDLMRHFDIDLAVDAARQCLLLLQDDRLRMCRACLAPSIADTLARAMQVAQDDQLGGHVDEGQCQLLVLSMWHLPRSLVGAYLPETCRHVAQLAADRGRVRLFAQLVLVTLSDPLDGDRFASSDALESVLHNPWVVASLQDASDTNVFRGEFVSALCRLALRMGAVISGKYLARRHESDGLLLEELDHWCATATLLLRQFTKCINWSTNAGDHAQQSYVTLLGFVCQLVYREGPLRNALAAKVGNTMTVEVEKVCTSLMEWHLRESTPSVWARFQLVHLLCQHLRQICGEDPDELYARACELLHVLEHDLLCKDQRRALRYSLQAAKDGPLGGGRSDVLLHPYEHTFQQVLALGSLVSLCVNVPTIAQQCMELVRGWERELYEVVGSMAVLLPPPLKERIELAKRRIAAVSTEDISRNDAIGPLQPTNGHAFTFSPSTMTSPVNMLDVLADLPQGSPRRSSRGGVQHQFTQWLRVPSTVGIVNQTAATIHSRVAPEVVASLDEAFDAHFRQLQGRSVHRRDVELSDAIELNNHFDVYPRWRPVSGSSDLLTVLVRHSVIPSTCTANISVKVVNGSGFKIPFFKIELMLSDTMVRGIQVHSDVAADGVEFMPADSYVIRNFTVQLKRLACHRLRVVVIYPDVESEDLAAFYPRQAGVSSAGGDHGDDGDHDEDGAAGGGGAGGASSKQHIRVETDAHNISSFAQLVPYAFSLAPPPTVHGAREASSRLPLTVFNALWHKCRQRLHVAIRCLKSPNPAAFIRDDLTRSAEYTTATNAIVDFAPAAAAAAEKSSSWISNCTHRVAWAFRSLWGEPVLFRLYATRVAVAESSTSPVQGAAPGALASNYRQKQPTMWTGRLECAVASSTSKAAIQATLAETLSILTHGLYEVVPTGFDPLAAAYQSEITDHLTLDTSDANTVDFVPVYGVKQWKTVQQQRAPLAQALRPSSLQSSASAATSPSSTIVPITLSFS